MMNTLSKEKLYYTLLDSFKEYGGTEDDMLRFIDNVNYLKGDSFSFESKGTDLSVESFLLQKDNPILNVLNELNITYRITYGKYVYQYTIFNGKVSIVEHKDKEINGYDILSSLHKHKEPSITLGVNINDIKDFLTKEGMYLHRRNRLKCL